MARTKGGVEGTGKIRVRIVEFDLEGSDSSLEEGLKTIAAALSRTGPPGGQRLITRSHGGNGADALAAPAAEELLEEESPEDETPAAAPRKPSVARRPIPRCTVLEDFKLNDVEPALRDFAMEKDPKTDFSKYLVVAFWAKEYKKIEELGINHFYTAFKAMTWAPPKDVGQPIRDLIKKGHFSKGSAAGTARINHVGDQVVIEMGKGA